MLDKRIQRLLLYVAAVFVVVLVTDYLSHIPKALAIDFTEDQGSKYREVREKARAIWKEADSEVKAAWAGLDFQLTNDDGSTQSYFDEVMTLKLSGDNMLKDFNLGFALRVSIAVLIFLAVIYAVKELRVDHSKAKWILIPAIAVLGISYSLLVNKLAGVNPAFYMVLAAGASVGLFILYNVRSFYPWLILGGISTATYLRLVLTNFGSFEDFIARAQLSPIGFWTVHFVGYFVFFSVCLYAFYRHLCEEVFKLEDNLDTSPDLSA